MRSARKPILIMAAAIIACLCFAFAAQANSYWFWQGNLPDSGGHRAKTSAYAGGGATWYVRMSWTSGTHDMNFIVIDSGGTWHGFDAFTYGTEYNPGTYYDRVLGYNGAVSGAGCENPSGLSTVYVNCFNGLNP